MRGPSTAILAVCALALALPGCFTRTVRENVYTRSGVEVTLRSQKKGTRPIDRGFQHPAAVSLQRMSYILGAVDVDWPPEKKKKDKERRAAFHADILMPVSKALTDSFEQADSSQELVVTIVRKQRRLGLFHKKFLTSFIAYMADDHLFLSFSRIEWEIPKDKENDPLPEPRYGKKEQSFTVVQRRSMTRYASQVLAVQWRDPYFSRPVRTAGGVGGKQQRRTILMESPIPAEELAEGELEVKLDRLEPDDLRELADLEDARRAGEITEGEYQKRRRQLLDSGSRF